MSFTIKTLFILLYERLSCAADVAVLDTSVAMTRLKFSDKAMVKLPFPQYNSNKSSFLISCLVTFWAQDIINSQMCPFGCEKVASTFYFK